MVLQQNTSDMTKRSSIDQEETLSVGSPRIPLTSQIGQLQKLDEGFKDKPEKKPKKAQLEQQQMLQQQAQLQKMMSDLQKQYEASTRSQQFQQPAPTQSLFGQMGHNMGSLMAADVPVSLLDAESKFLLSNLIGHPFINIHSLKHSLTLCSHHLQEMYITIRKLEIDRDYAMSLLESTKKRYEEEITAIETSYKFICFCKIKHMSRITLLEETHKSKEERLRDDNEQQLQQYLTRIRNIEQEKSDQQSQYYRKLDEFEREKSQEFDKIKEIHRNAMEQLRKDNEETLLRLKRAKDQQIEVAAESHNTTRALVEAAEMIQHNAKDLGDLHKKVDNWHSMGLDEREISLRSKDEQLRKRLTKQQDENENERRRLEDLVSKLETQLREQTRVLDEERWRMKQEQTRNMSQQTALEEERRLWTEQQARERANIEKTRETLLEEQKSILSQLHRERQSLAEERAAFSVSQKLQRDEGEEYNLKLSQAKAEFEATMKAISEEKSKSFNRKQDLLEEEERMKEESRLFEQKQNKLKNKEAELLDAATLLKERSEEVDEMYMEAQRKYEEGMKALEKSQTVESEENMRLSNIQGQIQVLRVKEKEIAEERLRLSKEKKEVENLRQTLLCPNCRTPSSGNGFVKPAVNGPMVMIPNNNIPIMQPAVSSPILSSNLVQTVQSSTHVQNPALQKSINSVEAITESIKNDRSIRLWKMEAVKDKQYLEEQSLFLYTLKHMPYHQSSQDT
ncbi:hypothetical protein KUTeg_004312 [Tegillarca granosa]|uniref:Fas-binding factor 1 C-terminal domain-containing protein n=1 Tax=Tegillarca granosa TaxID=220873 RepID=A0ABQ9FPL0_TEGGR|nr:hypothetical protein KUTeg_004312 [Tegillarca granosa]